MPNWCYNDVKISHDDPAMIKRLAESKTPLNEFIPTPAELLENEGWYDWRVDNWGTKWDVEFDNAFVMDEGKTVSLSFHSAWSPPIAAYEKLKEMGFEIYALYMEPGMGFAGEWEDGDDYCVEYDFTNDNWADNMSENLADFLQGEYESWLEWNAEIIEEEKANVG